MISALTGDATSFELVTHWHLAAPPEPVWRALTRVEEWPRWWRHVRSVQQLRAGDERGVGALRRVRWSSRLPYGIEIDVEVIEAVRQRRLRGRASGELEGEGLWELFPVGDTTRVRTTWRVELTKPWMRQLAPLAAPLFRWNHDGVMRAGGEGLAGYLGVALLQAG